MDGSVKFEVGQTVVHPQHGLAVVENLERRTFNGKELQYVVLDREEDDLKLRVPVEQLEEIGVRSAIGDERVEAVYEALGEEPFELSKSWQKRRARNDRRLGSGDPVKIAYVIRDLLDYERRHDGMPQIDKRTLDEARQRLVNELVAATDEDPAEIERKIDEALAVHA